MYTYIKDTSRDITWKNMSTLITRNWLTYPYYNSYQISALYAHCIHFCLNVHVRKLVLTDSSQPYRLLFVFRIFQILLIVVLNINVNINNAQTLTPSGQTLGPQLLLLLLSPFLCISHFFLDQLLPIFILIFSKYSYNNYHAELGTRRHFPYWPHSTLK